MRLDAGVSGAVRNTISSLAVPTTVVAIPVCNEEERIGACLTALAAQAGVDVSALGVLLFLNNCTDRTTAIVASASLPFQLRVIARTHPQASAGWARRVAMEEAAVWLRSGVSGCRVLMTTDADSRVPRDWVARNLAAIDAGASVVAGRIALDPDDAALLPSALHARGRREGAYEALLTEICARLDPEMGNPWPCHWSKSGATIAVSLEAYELAGGMPDQPTGEDRAFVDAIVSRDLVARHDPSIVVVTSGRLEGRATGGVADTIRLRCKIPESPCDDSLETTLRVVMRCLLRRRLRRVWHAGTFREIGKWAPDLEVPDALARQIATAPFFGEAHAAIQAASPHLTYKPIRPKQISLQMCIAWPLSRLLRLRDWFTEPSQVLPLQGSFNERNAASASAIRPPRRRREHPVS